MGGLVSGLNISIIHHHEEMTQWPGQARGSRHGSGYREFAGGNFLPNVELTALVSSDL